MHRKIIGLLLLVIVIGSVVWLLLRSYSSTQGSSWKAIPENAAMVIEVNEPQLLINTLQQENETWENLASQPAFGSYRDALLFVDSLLQSVTVSERLHNPPGIVLSFHVGDNGSIGILAQLLPANKNMLEQLKKSLQDRYNTVNYKGYKHAFKLYREGSNREILLGYVNGAIICSADESLFLSSLKSVQSALQHFSEKPGFKKLVATSGSNVDARVFIQYKYLGEFIGSFALTGYQTSLKGLGNFADWSEMDVLFKRKEVILSGFTITDSTGKQPLEQLARKEPVRHVSLDLIPFNSDLLLSHTLPEDWVSDVDPDKFQEGLKVKLSDFLAQFSGEIALVSNGPRGSNDNHWFLAKMNESEAAAKLFKKMSTISGGGNQVNGNRRFSEIRYPAFIPGVFGQQFSMIRGGWYVFIEDYVVFGNSPQSLVNFLRYYDTGKTLELYEGFKAVSDNLSGESNLLLLIDPRSLFKEAGDYLNTETIEELGNYAETVRSLRAFAVQFTRSDPYVFTLLYLLSDQNAIEEENVAIWKCELDGKIAGKPFLVKDHKTGMFNVVVFDEDANIYLISTDGRVLWKKRVDALPESPIYQVDYYKNGKVQYLFNTRDFIYLIDKNGENVASYPRKLNPSATNGLNLFDYENKKDYRLLVAQSDKRIYNYTLKGQQVKGWVKPRTANIVADPVTRLVAERKDYILFNDLDNNITIVNRRGNERIKLKEKPNKAKNSSFYVNMTNSKGIIITTNEEGKLTYIGKSGMLSYTDFGNFSPIHFFLYDDFNGDGAMDFIYVDGNELKVFDRFKNVLFAYTFESTISIKPEFFSLGRNQKVLGIVADQEKAVYLFDKKGNPIISRGLIGETPFTVGSLDNSNEINLITAADNILYNYRLK